MTLAGLCLGLALINAAFGLSFLDLVQMAGADVTFTGRTEIWTFILEKLEGRWFSGYGFGAFWGTGGDSPNLSASSPYIWYLDSAHNGYLDIMANVGLFGLVGLAVMLIHFAVSVDSVHSREPLFVRHLWLFVLFVLCHNITESSIYRATENTLWMLFLLAVLCASRLVAVDRRI
jgi:O-antigen ligase